MGKGSRIAFQSGILLLCAWICKPIVTLEAEAIQVRPGAQQLPQADRRLTVGPPAAPSFNADWPSAERTIRGPVDPITYRPAARETTAHRIVEMLLGGPKVDWASPGDPIATDPVTRRYLEAPTQIAPGWLRPVAVQASRRP